MDIVIDVFAVIGILWVLLVASKLVEIKVPNLQEAAILVSIVLGVTALFYRILEITLFS